MKQPFSIKKFEAGNFRLVIEQYANGRSEYGVATQYIEQVKIATTEFETLEIEQTGDIYHIGLKKEGNPITNFTNLFRR